MPIPNVSVSKVKWVLKSGKIKIGAMENTFFSPVKACYASGNHSKKSFVSSLVKGAAMEA